MKKSLSCLMLIGCLLITTACPTRTPYGRAGEAALNMTDTLKTGADTVDQLRVEKVLTVAEEREALQDMQALNEIDVIFASCIVQAHKLTHDEAIVGCAESALAGVKNSTLLMAFRVTNPHAQQTVTGIGQSIVLLLETAIGALQVMKTKP